MPRDGDHVAAGDPPVGARLVLEPREDEPAIDREEVAREDARVGAAGAERAIGVDPRHQPVDRLEAAEAREERLLHQVAIEEVLQGRDVDGEDHRVCGQLGLAPEDVVGGVGSDRADRRARLDDPHAVDASGLAEQPRHPGAAKDADPEVPGVGGQRTHQVLVGAATEELEARATGGREIGGGEKALRGGEGDEARIVGRARRQRGEEQRLKLLGEPVTGRKLRHRLQVLEGIVGARIEPEEFHQRRRQRGQLAGAEFEEAVAGGEERRQAAERRAPAGTVGEEGLGDGGVAAPVKDPGGAHLPEALAAARPVEQRGEVQVGVADGVNSVFPAEEPLPAVVAKAQLALAGQLAAERGARLEQGHAHASFGEMDRCGQAGNAGSDHEDVPVLHGCLQVPAIRADCGRVGNLCDAARPEPDRNAFV